MLLKSETAPKEGTLQVFPDILLANAYIILRPFFTPVDAPQGDPLDSANWKYGTHTNPRVSAELEVMITRQTSLRRISLAYTPLAKDSWALGRIPKVIPTCDY